MQVRQMVFLAKLHLIDDDGQIHVFIQIYLSVGTHSNPGLLLVIITAATHELSFIDSYKSKTTFL